MAEQAGRKGPRPPLTQQEWKLIEELRQYQFAEVKVEMKNGQPHRVIGGITSKML